MDYKHLLSDEVVREINFKEFVAKAESLSSQEITETIPCFMELSYGALRESTFWGAIELIQKHVSSGSQLMDEQSVRHVLNAVFRNTGYFRHRDRRIHLDELFKLALSIENANVDGLVFQCIVRIFDPKDEGNNWDDEEYLDQVDEVDKALLSSHVFKIVNSISDTALIEESLAIITRTRLAMSPEWGLAANRLDLDGLKRVYPLNRLHDLNRWVGQFCREDTSNPTRLQLLAIQHHMDISMKLFSEHAYRSQVLNGNNKIHSPGIIAALAPHATLEDYHKTLGMGLFQTFSWYQSLSEKGKYLAKKVLSKDSIGFFETLHYKAFEVLADLCRRDLIEHIQEISEATEEDVSSLTPLELIAVRKLIYHSDDQGSSWQINRRTQIGSDMSHAYANAMRIFADDDALISGVHKIALKAEVIDSVFLKGLAPRPLHNLVSPGVKAKRMTTDFEI